MRKLKILLFFVLSFAFPVLDAGTVNMMNDSPFSLRAVVRANDGTWKGESVVTSQNTYQWTDTWDGYSNPVRSQTPYSVTWFCLDGSTFSVNTNVADASMVTAMGGDGARQCRGKNLQQQPTGPAPYMPIPQQPNQGGQSGQGQSQPMPEQVPPYPAPQPMYETPQYNVQPQNEYNQGGQ